MDKIVLIIVSLAILNYLLRLVPMVTLSKREIPHALARFLDMTPCAVIAVMVASGVLTPGQELDLSLDNFYLLAFFPTLAVALKTKSLVWTLLGGMLAVAAIRYSFQLY